MRAIFFGTRGIDASVVIAGLSVLAAAFPSVSAPCGSPDMLFEVIASKSGHFSRWDERDGTAVPTLLT